MYTGTVPFVDVTQSQVTQTYLLQLRPGQPRATRLVRRSPGLASMD